jgi:AraC-like DNA-binding protein
MQQQGLASRLRLPCVNGSKCGPPGQERNVNLSHLAPARDATMAASVGNAPPAQGGLHPYKLRQALELIKAHIDRPIHLAQLAAAVALSPFHFHRAFKRSMGMTPHQYIVQTRIERAKSLLAESDLPLAVVAAQLGFADQSHFTSAFRKTTSMTPRNYRNVTATVRSPHETPADGHEFVLAH